MVNKCQALDSKKSFQGLCSLQQKIKTPRLSKFHEDFLCLDESMVKAFLKNLKGKMKIIQKPHHIGNKFQTLCDTKL